MRPSKISLFFGLCIYLCLSLLAGCAAPAGPPSPAAPTNPTLEPSNTALPPTATPFPPTNTPAPTETATPSPTPTPLQHPGVQGYHHMAYDSESDRIVLLPRQASSSIIIAGKTWIYNLNANTWQLSGGPPTGEGPMAYDAQSDRIILFLGASYVPPGDLFPMGQTWAYNTNTDQWTNMEPAESPYDLLGARMVYDAESDRMILFGGIDVETLQDQPETWAYDYDNNTWTNLQPIGEPPAGSNYFNMSYDSAADRVIIWRRGFNSNTGVAEFKIGAYDYNSNTWEQRVQDRYPDVDHYSAMVFDPVTGLNILFGGCDFAEKPANETWGYDYANNSWKRFLIPNSPSARGWHAMAYDDQAGVIMLYGGGTTRDDFTDETWQYDPATSTWSRLDAEP